jgi:hypothetical protein
VRGNSLATKSRALWLMEGDSNTWFFHKVTNFHRRYNRVEALHINGVLSYNLAKVKDHVV